MSGLTLIASYPKSGNTWMRAFLTSLDLGRTPDINSEMGAITSLSSRNFNDRFADLEHADLTPAEVAIMRGFVSRRIAALRKGIYKVHEANVVPRGGVEPAIPSDIIDRVLYIVRDPRDVLVSAAHHFGWSFETMAAVMSDERFRMGLSTVKPNNRVEHEVGGWSTHVARWIDAADLRVHLLRYEDMKMQPEESFTAACRFLDLPVSPQDIARAIDATRFDRLAGQEREKGFAERSSRSSQPFFRQGQAGAWRTVLPPALAATIVEQHGPMMRRLGYI